MKNPMRTLQTPDKHIRALVFSVAVLEFSGKSCDQRRASLKPKLKKRRATLRSDPIGSLSVHAAPNDFTLSELPFSKTAKRTMENKAPGRGQKQVQNRRSESLNANDGGIHHRLNLFHPGWNEMCTLARF